jgi:glycerophosphoryl diester phosphodiesterase
MTTLKTNTSESDLPALKMIASERPLLIGHRGCCQFAPENTTPSFKLALEAGADMVELDYRHSKDGALMVIHDTELDRTTDARERWGRKHTPVASKTAAEIQALDAGSWFHPKFAGTKVPLLTEALDLICGSGGVALIERKAGDAAACIKLLRDKHLINHVVAISFDWNYLRAFHESEPDQVLGALGPASLLPDGRKLPRLSKKLSAVWLDELAKTGAKVVVWNRHVSKEAVQQAHQRGLKVWVYTINAMALADRLLDLGVDGIISNDPALIRKTIAQR